MHLIESNQTFAVIKQDPEVSAMQNILDMQLLLEIGSQLTQLVVIRFEWRQQLFWFDISEPSVCLICL